EIPSSAAASGELIFVSDGDSSPMQEQERIVRRSSRRKSTTGHVEIPQRRKIHKRSRETPEGRSEQERMEKEAADILGSMAMTPPEPSQAEMDRGDERLEEQDFQELAEPSTLPHEEEELASWRRKGKFPLIEEECSTPQ
ncbi:hypothetical protein KI387_031116, partial [Taxus chinensis]